MMNVEIKKFEHSPNLSDETTAFSADLYIEGKHVGTCFNRGNGGMTDYRAKDEESFRLIRQAEEYYRKQPEKWLESEEFAEGGFYTKQSLDSRIDDLVSDILFDKETKKIERRLPSIVKKLEVKNIVVGNVLTAINHLELNVPIAKFTANEQSLITLENIIKKHIIPTLKEGDKIFNTNIPISVYQKAGLRPDQYTTKPEEKQEEKKSPKNKKKKGI